MKRFTLLAVVVTALFAPASHAGELFIGLQWGQGSMEVPSGGARVDMDDDGFKGFAGYQFTRFISAELGYTDLGKFSETFQGVGINAEADLFSAMVVGILPATPKLSFFIKAGVADWSTSVTLTDMLGATHVDTGGNSFAYGGGISFLVGKRVAIRGEWETYEFGDVENVKFGSIGVQFNF
jgi:OOP family OmpA-OmpF porin